MLIFTGNIDFSCGIIFDFTLVLTPLVLTLKIQGSIQTSRKGKNTLNTYYTLLYVIYSTVRITCFAMTFFVQHTDLRVLDFFLINFSGLAAHFYTVYPCTSILTHCSVIIPIYLIFPYFPSLRGEANCSTLDYDLRSIMYST